MGVARLLIIYWRKGKLMFQITAIKSEDNIVCKQVIYKASFSISLTILKYILKNTFAYKPYSRYWCNIKM